MIPLWEVFAKVDDDRVEVNIVATGPLSPNDVVAIEHLLTRIEHLANHTTARRRLLRAASALRAIVVRWERQL